MLEEERTILVNSTAYTLDKRLILGSSKSDSSIILYNSILKSMLYLEKQIALGVEDYTAKLTYLEGALFNLRHTYDNICIYEQ